VVKNSVARRMDALESAEELIIQLHVAPKVASLHLRPSKTNAEPTSMPRGVVELPIDDSLGHDHPNLRILQAMQAAALAEIGRQLRSGPGQDVHIPQPLDLADLKRFPGGSS
jgi:hypothetical protein